MLIILLPLLLVVISVAICVPACSHLLQPHPLGSDGSGGSNFKSSIPPVPLALPLNVAAVALILFPIIVTLAFCPLLLTLATPVGVIVVIDIVIFSEIKQPPSPPNFLHLHSAIIVVVPIVVLPVIIVPVVKLFAVVVCGRHHHLQRPPLQSHLSPPLIPLTWFETATLIPVVVRQRHWILI